VDVRDIAESTLLLLGAGLVLLAAIGILRMPDLIIRMHATTKAATLGSALMVAAVAVHFGTVEVVTRAMAVIIFLFITAPVAAHMLARAAYFLGVPLWRHTIIDELGSHYDRETHELSAAEEEELAAIEAALIRDDR
jgi:multicomponent Na+:H+ antiporter subunit G